MTQALEKPKAKREERWARLYRSVESARAGMSKFRESRKAIVEQIVGNAYSDSGASEPVPVNEMRFAFYVYLRMLAPKHPQGLIVTRADAFKRQASELQIVANQALDGMSFWQTCEDAISDALTSVGIVKTSITHSESYAIPQYAGDGYPYSCVVDLDDFVFDFRANKWEDVEFIGNFYRMRKDDAQSDDSLDQSVVKQLEKSERRTHNESGEERTGTVSRGDSAPDKDSEYYDYVDLCDLYLPATKTFLTVSADMDRGLAPLRVSKWEGPREGPYDLLYFNKVPGQLMPLPPALNWKDMHDYINELFLKLIDQALRAKRVGFANAQNIEAAKATIAAKDGEVIVTTGNPAIAQMSFDGVDNNTFGFATSLMGLFNKLNGNIEVLAGLGPQSNTLGQDELINASANKQLVDMQERVFRFVASIIRKVCWIIQSDPLIDVNAYKSPEIRPDIQIPFRYTADNQPASLADFNIQVHPYSMTSQSPAARLSAINGFLQSVAIPMYQAMAAQGIVIDWQKFVDLWSQYSQLPEIKDLLKSAPQGPPEPGDEPLRKPPTSNRTYTRRNVTDTSPDAERMKMVSAMMSKGEGQAA
jgi:hypothetical protein